jgi:hypothetical protein
MRRWLLAVTMIAGSALAAGTAHAQKDAVQKDMVYADGQPCDGCGHSQTWGDKWDKFWHRVHVDWHRNNAWPEPFLSADRAAQRAPFCIQTDNGWKMQNTIGTFLFDDNQQLNRAGELQVKWIVTQAPLHRRAVFVLRGENAEQTNARIASVYAAVAKFADGAIPPVIPTNTEPAGWSGSYVDAMAQQFQSTIPAPRLPAGGGGEGGGQGGGEGQ